MNPAFLFIALGLGVASSLHCVGMCTPLQASLRNWLGLGPGSMVLYHVGRIGAYAGLGALAGLFAAILNALAFQQWIAWAAVGLVVLAALLHLAGHQVFAARLPIPLQQKLGEGLRRLQRYGNRRPVVFGLGLANGLLPCGMVYLALIGTLAVPGAAASALYMVAFGLGTLPALVASQWVLRRVKLAKATWVVATVLVASLLAYRAVTVPNPNTAGPNCSAPAAETAALTAPRVP